MTNQDLIALSIYHESVAPYAYAHDGDLFVRLRIGARLVARVEVAHFDKFNPNATKVITPASWYAQDGSTHDVYQARLVRDTKRFKYCFVLYSGSETYWYSRRGLTTTDPDDPTDTFEVAYLGERDTYQPPTWSSGTTIYHIFPERYCRGHNASRTRHHFVDWDATPTRTNHFGGNLAGIVEKLDDLTDLGINVIYLTPIFRAPSNHKYDTVDYFAIDPQFGTEDDLRKLVSECHQRGLRIVLDAVFNHMGKHHPVFQDLLRKGKNSCYSEWIYPKSWPLSTKARNYETFAYEPRMPKWRTANPEVEDYLCRVGEYWIDKADIDGWRLDVSDEVEHAFWRHFRERVKARKPDALICGEIWQLSSPWLQGDQFDTVMNYPFAQAVIEWLARQTIDAREFARRIEQLRIHYPEPVLPTLWNLVDSHDTPRLLTECEGDTTQSRLASFVQFTMAGAPVLYYGDEVGMMGGADPLCRGGMVWDEAHRDTQLRHHYRALIALRQRFRALQEGTMRPLLSELWHQSYAYVRKIDFDHGSTQQETVICLVNNAPEDIALQLVDPQLPQGRYECVFGSPLGAYADTGQVLAIPGKSASAWVWIEDKR